MQCYLHIKGDEMIDFNHVYSVVSTEFQTISAGTFISGVFYIWMAHKVSALSRSEGGKLIWLGISILLLKDILDSTSILYNSMFYVAIAILFTHRDIFTKPVKSFFQSIKQRSYNRYKRCEEKNREIEQRIANEKRKEEQALIAQKKQKQQEQFINRLSKKLDSF